MMNETPSITGLKPKRAPRGKQPSKQAPKNKAAVAMRRRKIVKAILEGKSVREAGIIGGFSPRTAETQASATLSNPKVQNSLLAEMEKQGLTDAYWVTKHRQLAEGKRYLPVRGLDAEAPSVPGYIEVPDHQAQAKALDIAHKLAGRYTERHEVDLKRPLHITIKKFASRGEQPKEGATT